MESSDLEDLVRKARAGDVAAFEEIVRRLSRRAVATAHLVAGDLHRGEEAAQDAFVVAWQKLDTLRDPAGFRKWFGTILTRLASRQRSRPHRPLTAEEEPWVSPCRPETEEERLPAVVRGLGPRYRQVLALRYVEGFSYREIADALSISVARVKSRLHDGREQIRRRLVEHGRSG